LIQFTHSDREQYRGGYNSNGNGGYNEYSGNNNGNSSRTGSYVCSGFNSSGNGNRGGYPNNSYGGNGNSNNGENVYYNGGGYIRNNGGGYTSNNGGSYISNNIGQGRWNAEQNNRAMNSSANNDSGYTDWNDGYTHQENQR
jgi:hypothetical protein